MDFNLIKWFGVVVVIGYLIYLICKWVFNHAPDPVKVIFLLTGIVSVPVAPPLIIANIKINKAAEEAEQNEWTVKVNKVIYNNAVVQWVKTGARFYMPLVPGLPKEGEIWKVRVAANYIRGEVFYEFDKLIK